MVCEGMSPLLIFTLIPSLCGGAGLSPLAFPLKSGKSSDNGSIPHACAFTILSIDKTMRKLETAELGRLTEEELKQTEKNKVIVVLDNVRSLLNVGSVFRTADAFLIQELWLTGITGAPPNRDIHKSALGSENTVDWKYMTDEALKRQLVIIRKEGWQIIAVEQIDSSISLQDFQTKPNGKYCLILGNEVNGVSEELLPLCDHALEIPQWGTKHSFNISVAAGIVMWEVVKKLRA